MNEDPLTDPTSLIAYRLANGASSHTTRSSSGDPGGAVFAAGAVGLAVIVIVAIACFV